MTIFPTALVKFHQAVESMEISAEVLLSLEDYERSMEIYPDVTSKWISNLNNSTQNLLVILSKGFSCKISTHEFAGYLLNISYYKTIFRSEFDTFPAIDTQKNKIPKVLTVETACLVPSKWSCSIIFHWTKGQLSREKNMSGWYKLGCSFGPTTTAEWWWHVVLAAGKNCAVKSRNFRWTSAKIHVWYMPFDM